MPTNRTNPFSVLIVEDEAILALELSIRLEAEGYLVAGTATTGRQALALFMQPQFPIDVILCDINLRGDWNGIDTARQLNNQRAVPIIYLSALTDQATIEQAKQTHPAAYLTKPVTTDSLRIAIEIALSNFYPALPAGQAVDQQPPVTLPLSARDGEMILQVDDYIFLKQNYQFIRLRQEDVLYVEADDKYTTVVTRTRKFVLRLSLGVLLQRLSNMKLVRVHRSFAVNLPNVEAFSDNEVQVSGQNIPLGRVYKEEFLQNFRI
ncbi:response regulator transcription factor [Spirosoma agri]|uniref:Response regulator transcription factor n=1 Tax=Spirosoma agri TaxID=1987381 RepID=A0A6M0ISH0_9BACT|nr:response regulator [Spirosoma agri]NEU69993.1 response regulator transcription factor [Spirosoma agri]